MEIVVRLQLGHILSHYPKNLVDKGPRASIGYKFNSYQRDTFCLNGR